MCSCCIRQATSCCFDFALSKPSPSIKSIPHFPINSLSCLLLSVAGSAQLANALLSEHNKACVYPAVLGGRSTDVIFWGTLCNGTQVLACRIIDDGKFSCAGVSQVRIFVELFGQHCRAVRAGFSCSTLRLCESLYIARIFVVCVSAYARWHTEILT